MVQAFYPIKIYFLALYGLFGLTCLCLAGIAGRPLPLSLRRRAEAPALTILPIAFMAGVLLVVTMLRGSILLADAAIIAGILFAISTGRTAQPKTIVAGIATGIVVLSLVWWQMKPIGGAPLPLAGFAAVLGAMTYALADPARARAPFAVPVTVFAVAALALMGDLGIFKTSDLALFTLAHHWGAFIGPALHVRAGLVPFYDVPLQYGLGPTIAIAATCDGSDCWRGAQALFTGASLANGLLVLVMALAAGPKRGWLWQAAITIAVFAAIFFWPGFPSDGNMYMATPSVTGIRFLPLTVLAGLLFFGHWRWAIAAMVPALLWSPESAAMAIVVFGVAGTSRLGLIRAALLTAALLAGSYAALFLVHRLVYGLWIDPLALLEYVLHVPGPLPIDPFSDILLLAATLGLGGWLVYRAAPEPDEARRDLVATMLLFATASYCLGRSHPNNICNIAPYLVLVATRALDRSDADFATVRKSTAFGLAVSVAALALSPWNSKPFVMPPVADIESVVADFPSLQPDVERLRKEIPPGLGIADFGPAFVRHPSETSFWTPMDPSSLWSYVPGSRRQVYIARAAARLKRAGWAIIVDRQLFLLNDLATAYTISGEHGFDGGPIEPGTPNLHYTIACFTPKATLVPQRVGPACPAS